MPKSVSAHFVDTSVTLRDGRPGKTFLRLLGGFGARGSGDSCTWGCNRKKNIRRPADKSDELVALF